MLFASVKDAVSGMCKLYIYVWKYFNKLPEIYKQLLCSNVVTNNAPIFLA